MPPSKVEAIGRNEPRVVSLAQTRLLRSRMMQEGLLGRASWLINVTECILCEKELLLTRIGPTQRHCVVLSVRVENRFSLQHVIMIAIDSSCVTSIGVTRRRSCALQCPLIKMMNKRQCNGSLRVGMQACMTISDNGKARTFFYSLTPCIRSNIKV